MALLGKLRDTLLLILAALTFIVIVANLRFGRPVSDRVILALLSALVTIYTFVI